MHRFATAGIAIAVSMLLMTAADAQMQRPSTGVERSIPQASRCPGLPRPSASSYCARKIMCRNPRGHGEDRGLRRVEAASLRREGASEEAPQKVSQTWAYLRLPSIIITSAGKRIRCACRYE